MLKAFDKYVAELMYAKAYISSGGVKTLCRFNHFRSRQQFLFFCSHSLHSVWEEWNKDGSLSDYHKYISFKLQEAGRLFIFEGGEVVSHRNLLVYQNEILVSPDILNGSSRHMLGSFLQIQYSSCLSGVLHMDRKRNRITGTGGCPLDNRIYPPPGKGKNEKVIFPALVRIL